MDSGLKFPYVSYDLCVTFSGMGRKIEKYNCFKFLNSQT